MSEFNYLLSGGANHGELIKLPILLNIGTQFEMPTGTYEVYKVIKNRKLTVLCRQVNTEAWHLNHIQKTEIFSMTKTLPV